MAELAEPAGPEFAAVDLPPAASGGLSWCWELDLATVLDAVSGAAPWLREDASSAPPVASSAPPVVCSAPQTASSAPPAASSASPYSACESLTPYDPDMEADAAAYQDAVSAGRVREVPLDLVAGRIAESLAVGPGLASWLAHARATDLEDGALAGVAASFRRLASCAAAGELAAVAQIASRSAKNDRRAGVDSTGRPDRVTVDAAGQVALALAMSQDGASGWYSVRPDSYL
jgi:hypothetical protein